MSHLATAFIVLVCILCGALLGHCLRRILPEHHFSEESATAAKLAIALIATMAALVLGLLISSAKGTFDTVNSEIMQNAARVELLDRALAEYGPETEGLRGLLRRNYTLYVNILASGKPSQLARLSDHAAVRLMDSFQCNLAALSPLNPAQQHFQAEAIRIANEVFAAYWLALLQKEGSISTSLMVVLVSWLTIIFWSFGLFSPFNGTIVVALLMCALSASAAIFLILELDRPLDGLIRISPGPMRTVVLELGQ